MRKRSAFLLLIAMATLAACAGGVPGAPTAGAPASGAPESLYGGIDMSQHVKLKMFLIGTKAEDSEIVMHALSARLIERINASLEVEYIPWSDYVVKYPIVLAGSEQVDMIFAGDWCNYATEANKGAFFELTPEFIQTYMPLTSQCQNPVAIEQAKLGGRIYMITSNGTGIEGEAWFVIRGDLREAYGLPPIQTREQLEEYFRLVVENERDVIPYAAAQGVPFFHIFFEQRLGLNTVSADWITAYVDDAHVPDARAIHYRYLTPEYLEFAQLMKQYADWGFWPNSAISNTTQVRDSFQNGTSASLVWNMTIFLAGAQLEKNDEAWKAEYIDLYPGTVRRTTLFTNGGTAIAAISKNPERSAMCIDSLLHVPELNDFFKGGVEGRHWIDAGERFYAPGPDYDNYQWNHAQWAFNRPLDQRRVSTAISQLERDFEARNYEWVVHPAYEMFRFDYEPVKVEWALVEALQNEYVPLFELGIADDPAAAIEEFRRKLYDAGFARVEAEFKRQYEAWAAAQ